MEDNTHTHTSRIPATLTGQLLLGPVKKVRVATTMVVPIRFLFCRSLPSFQLTLFLPPPSPLPFGLLIGPHLSP